jgi:smad nuclear-interacting protein 1
MGSPSDGERDGRSRRHRDRDDDRRSRRKDSDREHDRDHNRLRRDRHRSRTPDSSRRRDRHRDSDRDRDRRRQRSRSREGRRHRHRDTEPDAAEDDGQAKRTEPLKRSGPLPTQEDSWAVTKGEEPEKPKEKPNYGTTGVLAAASNSVAQADGSSITLKYHEPPEARKPAPKDQWKMFVFKDGDIVDTIDIGLRTCWLVGRDAAVVDLPAEHPSISKQHAVIQFRYTEKRNEFGDKIGKVKPYIIDLESANGTILNEERIPDSRYLEVRNKDMIQFGHSAREYVFMLAPRE